MRITQYLCLPLLAAALCSVPIPASAANLSFTGFFTADDQMAIFSFVASGASPIISTLSYNGGTNNQGTVIPPGGFDTAIALFGPGAALGGGTPLIGQDSNGNGDSLLNTAAPPISIISGDMYWVVLTQFDNITNGTNFGTGFHETGNPNFTSTFGCGPGFFCDQLTFTNRTGNWALDISGVASAQQVSTVPEPETFLMLSAGLAGLLATRLRKSVSRQSLE